MTPPASAEISLQIGRVHVSRPSPGEVRLALTGRWREGQPRPVEEPLLVVQVEGRRHRFPADSHGGGEEPAGEWKAVFMLPDWAEPSQDGQAAIWVGNEVIPLPPLHPVTDETDEAGSAPDEAEPAPQPQPRNEPPLPQSQGKVEGEAQLTPGSAAIHPSAELRRSGPLADLLLKETVGALHAELDTRTAEAARLRGALADAEADLEVRAGNQARLETTLSELGVECRRLMEAVEEQARELEKLRGGAEQERAEGQRRLAELTAAHEQRLAEMSVAAERHDAELGSLRRELATAHVSRDAAISEATGLQAELSRVGAELAVTRERVSSESSDLGEANRLLADAKALADRVQAQREEH